MLVLTRKVGQSIQVGDDVRITVIRAGDQVRIGIEAPSHVNIVRSEIVDRGPPLKRRRPAEAAA